jgi:hypothetical protein
MLCLLATAVAQTPPTSEPTRVTRLPDIRMRDVCILPDQASKTYTMVGPGGRGVRAYTSKDLVNWEGPQMIFRAPDDIWGEIPIVSIWAPEMHAYKGKYYLFLTFDGKLMMVLHSPNGPAARPRIFEMEDTGETLRITKEFTGTNP